MQDSLNRGESPFSSVALYALSRVLDDNNPEERALGITAGLVWGRAAVATIVYEDYGVSPGMRLGIRAAIAAGRSVEFRKIGTP
jgi:hypothetical protein